MLSEFFAFFTKSENNFHIGHLVIFDITIPKNFPMWYPGSFVGPPGVLGILGEWLFIFRDLGSTGNYFRGAGEQAHSFGDLGSPAKKQKNKGKASIFFDF